MGDYDLTRLGSTEFQHLTQALALKLLGGEVGVFGAGRDGGRDMTVDGPVPTGSGTMWTGYTVVQVKHRQRPGDPGSNATWLRNEIRKELDAWTSKDPKRKGRRPENLLFITNVVLSAVPGSGVDHVLTIFDGYRDTLPLGNYGVWHYDHVCRLLDDAPGIRTTYSGLITPGDVFEQMREVLGVDTGDLGEILRIHAAMELQAEQWVRLGEAGSKMNDKLPLGRVAIDLRATQNRVDDEPQVWVLRHVVEVGDQVHRRSVRQQEPHMVLVGGPGQGKTTLAQMLCQIYRLALLDDASTFGEQVAAAVTTMRAHLESLGVPTPASRRWPLRVELSKYADQLAGDSELTLLRYVAERIAHRSNRPMTPARLQTWLRQWPWLLVLDGFDEVASPQVRDTLVERVQDLLVDVAANDADMLIVATTRPQGYAGEFTADHYAHLTLTDLERSEAIGYARRLAEVRHGDDPEMKQNVIERIDEAADEELTARLMRTPLQVTIMSLLLEGRPRVPQDRHGLFDAYYETVYSRETGKVTSAGSFLDQHKKTIDALHARVGLLLQVQADTGATTDTVLPQDTLRDLARARLVQGGFEAESADYLVDRIVKAATDRLVLLVPKGDGDIGFEVRSLQEFMAARAIVAGSEPEVLQRLRVIATSAHWRNTWLLAAGQVGAQREWMVQQLVQLLSSLDSDSFLNMQLVPSASLAAALLDDGFARNAPALERQLLRLAVAAIQQPLDPVTFDVAASLQHTAQAGTSGVYSTIANAARQALSADPPQQVTAAVMLRVWARTPGGGLGTLGQQRTANLGAVLGELHAEALRRHFLALGTRKSNEAKLRDRRSLGSYMPALTDSGEDAEAHQALREALDKMTVGYISGTDGRVAVVPRLITPDHEVLEAALTRDSIVESLAERLLELPAEEWPVTSALLTVVRQWLAHRPVGADLLAATTFDGEAAG